MILVKRIMQDNVGSILVSVILGVGLAAMFQRVCHGDKCVVVRAPDLKLLEQNTYRLHDNCYKYTPEVVPCPLVRQGAPLSSSSNK